MSKDATTSTDPALKENSEDS